MKRWTTYSGGWRIADTHTTEGGTPRVDSSGRVPDHLPTAISSLSAVSNMPVLPTAPGWLHADSLDPLLRQTGQSPGSLGERR